MPTDASLGEITLTFNEIDTVFFFKKKHLFYCKRGRTAFFCVMGLLGIIGGLVKIKGGHFVRKEQQRSYIIFLPTLHKLIETSIAVVGSLQ